MTGDRPSETNETSWMVVYVTSNTMEAHIIAGRLESEGIPAMVFQPPGASAYGLTIGAFGPLRVLVLTRDYDRAITVLDQPAPAELPDDSEHIIFGDDSLDDDDEEYDDDDDAQ